jgi:SAM-dependent methyltransferase
MKRPDLGFWDSFPDKYISLKNENRKTILFPAIKDSITKTKIDKILDYGGGDGFFLDTFENECKKVLYDPSKGMIKFAKENRKTISSFYTSDYKILENNFDLITLIHVVTVIKDDTELNRIFSKIRELLSDDGEFIIGMTHPAFKNNYFSTFHTDFSEGTLEFDYLNNSLVYNVLLDSDSKESFVSFECYHRSLSCIFNMLIKNGFTIKKVSEIQDKDFNNPDKKYLFPPFLIINCKK